MTAARCTGTYKTGCRCARCRHVHNLDLRSWRRRRAQHGAPLIVDAVGVTRRLQALAVLGYGATEIAARTGLPRSSMSHAVHGRYGTCTVARRDDVHAAYQQLQDRTPTFPAAARTAAAARARGWVPPIAWDDDTIDDPATVPFAGERVDVDQVAVLRAVTGLRPVALNRAERRMVVTALTGRGLTATAIASQLATTPRNVVRDRALVGGGGG